MIIDNLTLSFDPLPSSLEKQLSSKDFTTYLTLLEKIQAKPKGICTEIEPLHAKYPRVPEIANMLSYAYALHKEIKKSEELIKQTFKDNPDYLFGKLNYADLCLRKKQPMLIPTLFPSFNLRELYPHRSLFHFTEYRGVMVLAAHYHLARQERAQAIAYYEKAYTVDPAHPSVVHLEKKIFKKPFLKKVAQFFRIS